MNCSPNRNDPVCQKAVNTARLVKITYFNGRTIDYARHNNRGGNWIHGLHHGQGVIVNNVLHVVHDQAVRRLKVPTSGVYLQTCTIGQGIRLVHLVRPLSMISHYRRNDSRDITFSDAPYRSLHIIVFPDG